MLSKEQINLLTEIRQTLKENIDEKVLNSGKRFFKEEIKTYGVSLVLVSKIGKEYFKLVKNFSKQEIFNICEELWKSGYSEEGHIACNWSYYIEKQYEPADFKVFQHWVEKYVTNWATCDALCNHTVGTFIEMYPQFVPELKEWAKSPNQWMRRAAAVTFIIPARRGLFLEDIFEIADILLMSKEDLVQKGYGWMLKAASEAHQQEVFNYVMSKKEVMPRTAFRYAIEKMPADLKAEAMKK